MFVLCVCMYVYANMYTWLQDLQTDLIDSLILLCARVPLALPFRVCLHERACYEI